MAFQPTYPSPYMETIDATKDNTFKCLINPKDTITSARLNLFRNDSSMFDLVVTGEVFGSNLTSDIIVIDVILSSKLNDLTEINYSKINYYLSINGELLRIQKIVKDEDSDMYSIYVDSTLQTDITVEDNYYFYIYADRQIIDLPSDYFPFVWENSDGWFSYNIAGNTLSNGYDYKWSVDLICDDISKITDLTIIDHSSYTNFGDDNLSVDYITVEYSDSLYQTLNNGIATFFCIGTERRRVSSSFGVDLRANTITLRAVADDSGNLFTTPIKGRYGTLYADETLVSSPEYYFRTRECPELVFDVEQIIQASVHTFTAGYSQVDKTRIAYFKFDVSRNGSVIDTSGEVFEQKVEYTAKNLIEGNYSVTLTVVNDDGVELSETREFTVSYEWTVSSSTPVVSIDNNIGKIAIDFSGCFDTTYVIDSFIVQRVDVATNNIKYVTRLQPDVNYFEDYNIVNHHSYKYNIIVVRPEWKPEGDTASSYVYAELITTPVITTDFTEWSLISVLPSGVDNEYTVDYDNIWTFFANVTPDAYVPVYNKTYLSGMGQFPKEVQHEDNYLEGGLSCLIGSIDHQDDYINDNIHTLEKWQAFCKSPTLKLLKTPKGYVIPCSIKDTSIDVNPKVLEEISTISFKFTQIADASHLSVYGLGGV